MPTSEDYKRSAEECRRLAQQAHDDIEREALLRMAAQWDRLAQHKAKVEGRQGLLNSKRARAAYFDFATAVSTC
jgi:hypothetical protein